MKSQSMVLILSMSALTACGGGGGGTTEPTTPQPTTPIEGGSPDEGDTENGAGSNSLNTKSVSAELDAFTKTTSYGRPIDGATGRLNYVIEQNSQNEPTLISVVFSDGAGVDFSLTEDQMNDHIDEENPAGVLIVANGNDGTKTLKFVTDNVNYGAGFASEFNLLTRAGAVTVFEKGNSLVGLPSIETATYSGTLVGVLSEIGEHPFSTEADLRAVANFNLKTLNVRASNTIAYGLDREPINGDFTSQDFDATLTDANGDHTFEGGVTDLDGKSGSITATLYGPEAQAVAGTGFVEDSDQDRAHIFAFGAQR